eukprot:scaffold5127_cov64-Phaeocystis_antarctica.AAC.14
MTGYIARWASFSGAVSFQHQLDTRGRSEPSCETSELRASEASTSRLSSLASCWAALRSYCNHCSRPKCIHFLSQGPARRWALRSCRPLSSYPGRFGKSRTPDNRTGIAASAQIDGARAARAATMTRWQRCRAAGCQLCGPGWRPRGRSSARRPQCTEEVPLLVVFLLE